MAKALLIYYYTRVLYFARGLARAYFGAALRPC